MQLICLSSAWIWERCTQTRMSCDAITYFAVAFDLAPDLASTAIQHVQHFLPPAHNDQWLQRERIDGPVQCEKGIGCAIGIFRCNRNARQWFPGIRCVVIAATYKDLLDQLYRWGNSLGHIPCSQRNKQSYPPTCPISCSLASAAGDVCPRTGKA